MRNGANSVWLVEVVTDLTRGSGPSRAKRSQRHPIVKRMKLEVPLMDLWRTRLRRTDQFQ